MEPLLDEYLEKHGVGSVDELDPEERQTYESWQLILQSDEISPAKLLTYLNAEMAAIDKQFELLDNSPQKNDRLILKRVIYRRLAALINSPKTERENLLRYLHNVVNTK